MNLWLKFSSIEHTVLLNLNTMVLMCVIVLSVYMRVYTYVCMYVVAKCLIFVM